MRFPRAILLAALAALALPALAQAQATSNMENLPPEGGRRTRSSSSRRTCSLTDAEGEGFLAGLRRVSRTTCRRSTSGWAKAIAEVRRRIQQGPGTQTRRRRICSGGRSQSRRRTPQAQAAPTVPASSRRRCRRRRPRATSRSRTRSAPRFGTSLPRRFRWSSEDLRHVGADSGRRRLALGLPAPNAPAKHEGGISVFPANPRSLSSGAAPRAHQPPRSDFEVCAERPVVADSRGSRCSPKAGFGRIRLLPRRAAYGLSCELTQPAMS